MQQKTNSFVEAVKRATKKQLQDEKLGFDFGNVNKWVWEMNTQHHVALSGKGIKDL